MKKMKKGQTPTSCSIEEKKLVEGCREHFPWFILSRSEKVFYYDLLLKIIGPLGVPPSIVG